MRRGVGNSGFSRYACTTPVHATTASAITLVRLTRQHDSNKHPTPRRSLPFPGTHLMAAARSPDIAANCGPHVPQSC